MDWVLETEMPHSWLIRKIRDESMREACLYSSRVCGVLDVPWIEWAFDAWFVTHQKLVDGSGVWIWRLWCFRCPIDRVCDIFDASSFVRHLRCLAWLNKKFGDESRRGSASLQVDLHVSSVEFVMFRQLIRDSFLCDTVMWNITARETRWWI